MRRVALVCAAWLGCDKQSRSDLEARELLNPLKTHLPEKPVFIEPEDDPIAVRYKRHYSVIPQKLREAYEAVMYQDEMEELMDLTGANLNPEQLQQAFHILRHYPNFATVMMEGNKLGVTEVRMLCEGLLRQERIEDLDLAGCDIGDEGALELSRFLPQFKSLRQLRLSRNGMSPRGVAAVCNALKGSHLSSLWLSHNEVGEEGAQALGELLVGTKLKVLGLAHCGLNAGCMKRLTRGIERDKQLKHLMLHNNPLGPEGMKEFAMRLPSSLLNLDLANTRMGPDGARYLGMGLASTPGIKSIYIERNLIEDEGIHFIAASQNKFEKLRHLNISHNKLTSLTCTLLCSMLEHCREIRTLRASHSRFDKAMEGVTYRLPTLRFLDVRESHIYFHLTIKRNLPHARLDLSTSVDF